LLHALATSALAPGAVDTVRLLDALGVPKDATVAQAVEILTTSGQGRRKAVVAAAMKLRRESTGTVPGTVSNVPEVAEPRTEPSSRSGVEPQVNGNKHGSRNQRELWEPTPEVNGSRFPPL